MSAGVAAGLRIAIVGTGPMGIYSFQTLSVLPATAEITLIEKGPTAGIGLPYAPETATRHMLANISSIEIPPVTSSYLDWLRRQSPEKLASYGIATEDLSDRLFTPRLLLGEYFRDQFCALVDQARAAGRRIEVRETCEVTDVVVEAESLSLTLADGQRLGPFDRVVLATGHVFPDAEDATRSYFPSPWSGLIQSRIPAVRVGIMGTSLSSIDAALAVATQHGAFRPDGEELRFVPDGEGLSLTMMSWTGVLPEADFYCPIPYAPLEVMTDEALAQCANSEASLDAVFALFAAELSKADPAYALRIGLGGLTADSFSAAYFADRASADPFRWARKNLAEVERNKEHRITVPWRYAILRMHEKVEGIVSLLDEADRARFDKGMMRVFIDNYAAVPSESIRRLLALRDAGVLSVLALGEDYEMEVQPERTVIQAEGREHVFDVFIDARGQQSQETKDLPFPSLRRAILEAGQEVPELSESYALRDVPGYQGRLVLAAIPYLMHDRPFVQGITACAEIAAAIARGVTTGRRRRFARWA